MRDKRSIRLIAAVDQQGGLSRGGEIPWSFKEDWEHFKATTKGAHCIMGRGTYRDIWDRKPANTKAKKTLPGRQSWVVTSNPNIDDFKGVEGIGASLQIVWDQLPDDNNPVFILGGERLYRQAITWSHEVSLTVIPSIYNCDRFFPVAFLHKHFYIADGKPGSDGLMFATYRRRRSNESQGHTRGQRFNARA